LIEIILGGKILMKTNIVEKLNEVAKNRFGQNFEDNFSKYNASTTVALLLEAKGLLSKEEYDDLLELSNEKPLIH
jgi:hypothetical protein